MDDVARLEQGAASSLWGLVDGKPSLIPLQRGPGGVRPSDPALAACDVRIPLNLPDTAQLTELKAAYLIAFASFGYSWAAHVALDPIRKALQDGDAASLTRIPLFIAQDPNPELANTVLVADTHPILAVIGDDPRFGVVLPNGEAFAVTKDNASMSFHGYAVPWLTDRWWRTGEQPAFRWDCLAERPMFLVEVLSDAE